MLLRAASTDAEEEIILQQVRLSRPIRVSRPRRGPPSLLVHDVLLPPAPKNLVDDPHTNDLADRELHSDATSRRQSHHRRQLTDCVTFRYATEDSTQMHDRLEDD